MFNIYIQHNTLQCYIIQYTTLNYITLHYITYMRILGWETLLSFAYPAAGEEHPCPFFCCLWLSGTLVIAGVLAPSSLIILHYLGSKLSKHPAWVVLIFSLEPFLKCGLALGRATPPFKSVFGTYSPSFAVFQG